MSAIEDQNQDANERRRSKSRLSDAELRLFLERLNSDEPWVLDERPRCFVCGEGRSLALSKEHIIPQWLIRKFGLASDDSRLHPFNFSASLKIPYQKLIVPACKNCNSGFLHDLEIRVEKILRPHQKFHVFEGKDVGFWLAKILWGIAWLEMRAALENGGSEWAINQWKQLKPLRRFLQVIRKEAHFNEKTVPSSLFVFMCQRPKPTTHRFDFQVSVPYRSIYMRLGWLVFMAAFDMGFVAELNGKHFNDHQGKLLHPWQGPSS